MTGVNPLYFIVGMALLGLAPFFLMMVTSYVKIVVVTSLVRWRNWRKRFCMCRWLSATSG